MYGYSQLVVSVCFRVGHSLVVPAHVFRFSNLRFLAPFFSNLQTVVVVCICGHVIISKVVMFVVVFRLVLSLKKRVFVFFVWVFALCGSFLCFVFLAVVVDVILIGFQIGWYSAPHVCWFSFAN